MRPAAAILLMLLPALAQPGWALPATQSWVIGTWYGEGQPGDKSEMYMDSLGADGSFHAHHRWCRKGKAADQLQVGRWALKGDILSITVDTVNGRPTAAAETDVYRIVSHDGQQQHYVYLRLNFAYASHRVASDFKMPDCDLES